jgi:hypothetical protein
MERTTSNGYRSKRTRSTDRKHSRETKSGRRNLKNYQMLRMTKAGNIHSVWLLLLTDDWSRAWNRTSDSQVSAWNEWGISKRWDERIPSAPHSHPQQLLIFSVARP